VRREGGRAFAANCSGGGCSVGCFDECVAGHVARRVDAAVDGEAPRKTPQRGTPEPNLSKTSATAQGLVRRAEPRDREIENRFLVAGAVGIGDTTGSAPARNEA